MRLPVTKISSKLFNYVTADKTFVADSSDLNNIQFSQLTRRAYDDACDVGFEIVSERTGKAELFCFVKDHWSADMELQYVEFCGVGKHADLKVIVFND